MEFSSEARLKSLLKDLEKTGPEVKHGPQELIFQIISSFDHFLIAGVGDHIKAEGVSVVGNGDFLCVTIDTEKPDPVTWATQNFHKFPDSDLTPMSGALETARVAFFESTNRRKS